MQAALRLIVMMITLVVSGMSTAAYVDHPPSHTWFMNIGGGVTWVGLPGRTTVFNGAPAPDNQDQYSIDDVTTGMSQLAIGYRWYQNHPFLPYYDVSLRYQHVFLNHINGRIEQYSLPEFLNYNYQLGYEADSFMLMGKMDLVQYQRLLPYLSGGVGLILNHLNGYTETALPGVTPRISPGYRGNTSVSGALALGVGIDWIATDNVWVTLGYEHVFQGNVSTKTGVSSWSDTSLNIGRVQMDTVFLGLTANLPDVLMKG